MRLPIYFFTTLAVCLLLAFAVKVRAQSDFQVIGSSDFERCLKDTKLQNIDSLLLSCVKQLRADGFLEASVDKVEREGEVLKLTVHQGERYDIGSWTQTVNPTNFYGIGRQDTLDSPTKVSDLITQPENYLKGSGKEGYPFARLRYDSLTVREGSLSGRTTTWSGPRITYGGIRYVNEEEEEPVSTSYLERYLQLEPGRTYKSTEIAQVEQRLRGLRFVELKRPPVVVFESAQAFVYLDAKPRQTSRFDFLLGFLPNSAANNGQLLLTGDITLELENALRKGERLFFNFERLQPDVTELALEGAYPYLFESPFGVRGTFGLYRQMNDWLRVNYEAGGTYSLGGGSSYELFYEGGQAQLLGFDTAQVQQTMTLPTTLDANRNGFGMRLRIDKRDDVFDTRKGWHLITEGAASLRTVTVPGTIRDFGESLQKQADSIGGQTAQYRAALDVSNFIPLGRRGTFVTQLRGAILAGTQTPLVNELYRIGGNRLLRGFDEQTIEAQHYGVFTSEARLLIGGGSYLFAFGDQAVLVDPYRAGSNFDNPTGFGAGLRLATKSGGLSLTYAYGRRKSAPIEFDRAKIHIGYESRF